MSASKIPSLNAIDIGCPDFSLSARLFLDEVPTGASGHIVTKEHRAEARLRHICSAYGWQLKGPTMADNLIHFLVTK